MNLRPRPEALWPFAIELGTVIAVYGPLLLQREAFGIVDADFFHAWQLVINDALRHGEIAHWNPYMCGGVPALANPQSGALSPFNVLALFAMSPVVQMKVEVAAHLLLCWAGCRTLATRMDLPPVYGALGFLITACNGFIVFCVLHGQPIFYVYLLAPCLLALSWPARPTAGDIGLGLLLVCLLLLEDGVYAYLHTFSLLSGVALVRAVLTRSLHPLAVVATWAIAPLLVCAARLAPMAELLAEHPRTIESDDFLTLEMAARMLFHPDQLGLHINFRPEPPHRRWSAYGAYLGLVPAALALVGALARRAPNALSRAHRVAILATLLVSVALMFGNFAPWSPWALVRQLPGFTQFRAAERYAWVVIVLVAPLAMAGAASSVAWAGRGWNDPSRARGLAWLLVLATALSFISTLRPLFSHYVKPWERAYAEIDRAGYPFFNDDTASEQQMFPAVAHNRGVRFCWLGQVLPNRTYTGPLAWKTTPTGTTDQGIDAETWPNRLKARATFDVAGALVFNQNFHRDWEVTEGPLDAVVRDVEGLLVVDLPAGEHHIELRYRPRAFQRWLPVSIGSLSVLLGIGAFVRRRQIQHAPTWGRTPTPGS